MDLNIKFNLQDSNELITIPEHSPFQKSPREKSPREKSLKAPPPSPINNRDKKRDCDCFQLRCCS